MVVLTSIEQNVESFQFASEDLRNDEEFMSQMVKHNREALKWIGEELNDDKGFILECMKEHYGMALEHASPKWRDDEDVVLAAVKSSGYGESLFCHS